MKWTQLPLGPIQTNAYIIENDNREAIIVDPGEEFHKIKTFINEQRLNPVAVLLTHAHFDHIGALDEVRKEWQIPAFLHKNETDWITDPEKNGSLHFPLTKDLSLNPVEKVIEGPGPLTIQSFSFDVLETPGHSPGSVSFYLKDAGVVFSGDALFYGSIGRTDLYGGDSALLLKSIRSQLFTLPELTVVAPGHGFETTIKKEMESNPFLT
jgi:hydroxyacylglutathione hydrolase